MKEINLYTQAHLVVAAIRIFENQDNTSTSIEKVCEIISFSLEHGNFICKKLEELGIIEIVQGAYGPGLFIKDHLKIEEIPRDEEQSKLEEELEKFRKDREDLSNKVKSFQTENAERQKKLFTDLEKKLKQH